MNNEELITTKNRITCNRYKIETYNRDQISKGKKGERERKRNVKKVIDQKKTPQRNRSDDVT